MKTSLLLSATLLSVTMAYADNAFDSKLQELGITATTDLTDNLVIMLDEPTCAYANLTSITALPTETSDDLHAYLDFYDGQGNYFRKKVLLGLQGSDEMDKKSLAIEFCEDEWVGDVTTSITFGDWVSQDSYHLKAFYEDGFRGTAEVAYQLYAQMTERPDCYPKAFPVMLYVNGDFYGIMSWQLKKHRANYGLDKKTSAHVMLDGKLSQKNLWGGSVDWAAFEVRNPKDLYDMFGNDYDGDHPTELMDATSAAYEGKNKQKRCAEVKANILRLSQYNGELDALVNDGSDAATMQQNIAERFDVEELINYRLFSLVTNNYDGFSKNWLWFTTNGTQWTVAPYDCNLTFGYNDDTAEAYTLWPATQGSKKYDYQMKNSETDGPIRWITAYYQDQLKARYATLRKEGILTPENISGLFTSWTTRIGEANYAAEWTRWPESPLQLGREESLQRLNEWITLRLQLLDSFLGEEQSIASLPATSADIEAIYSPTGTPRSALTVGFNLVRYTDGTSRIIVK